MPAGQARPRSFKGVKHEDSSREFIQATAEGGLEFLSGMAREVQCGT